MWAQQAVTLAPGHGPARVQCGRRKHPGTHAQRSALEALEVWGSSGNAQDTLTCSTWGPRAPP